MVQTPNTVEIKKQIEDNEPKWYVLSVVSGQESLVVENLQERVKKQDLTEGVVDYFMPTINDISINAKGEKKVKPKKLYPGYVFVKSKMNDKIWYVIRNTPGVRIIVGAETHPIPLTDKEYNDMVNHIKEKNERSELTIPYKEGDMVVMQDGNFEGMKGLVKAIDAKKGLLQVNLEMLGRITPVTVEVNKVKLFD